MATTTPFTILTRQTTPTWGAGASTVYLFMYDRLPQDLLGTGNFTVSKCQFTGTEQRCICRPAQKLDSYRTRNSVSAVNHLLNQVSAYYILTWLPVYHLSFPTWTISCCYSNHEFALRFPRAGSTLAWWRRGQHQPTCSSLSTASLLHRGYVQIHIPVDVWSVWFPYQVKNWSLNFKG